MSNESGWQPVPPTHASGGFEPPQHAGGPPQQPPGWVPPPSPPPPPRGGPPALRPLNVGDVLDGMFRLFLRHWKTYLLALGVIVVPTQLLFAALQRDLVSDVGFLEMMADPTAAQAAAAGGPGLFEFGSAFGLSLLAALLITPLEVGVVSWLGARGHFGEHVDAGGALRAGLRRYPALVAANVLTWLALGAVGVVLALPAVGVAFGLGETVAAVLLVLPLSLLAVAGMIAVYTLFLLAPVAIIIEEQGPISGLARSFRLVRARFWGVLGIGLLAAIIAWIVGSVFTWPFAIPAFLFGGAVGLLFTTLGAVVAGLLASPLLPNAMALLYVDTRVRSEGLDLEAMTSALEGQGDWSRPA